MGNALSLLPSFIEMRDLVLRDHFVLITPLEQKGTLSVGVFGYLLGDLQFFGY